MSTLTDVMCFPGADNLITYPSQQGAEWLVTTRRPHALYLGVVCSGLGFGLLVYGPLPENAL